MSIKQNIKQRLKRPISLFLIRHSRYFDENWYRKNSPTPPPPDVDAVAHYYDGGWQTCDPSESFSHDAYWAANRRVRGIGVCPLADYLLNHVRKGRKLSRGSNRASYRRFRVLRGIKRFASQIYFRKLINKNSNARILVIAHIYYEDAIKEMLEYFKNLDCYAHWDLIVTTIETRDVERITRQIHCYKPDATIKVFPNKGFDIGPFLMTLKEIDLDQYDVVFKVQSKQNFPKKKGRLAIGIYMRGNDWFRYLFEGTLGAWQVHRNIDRLLHEPDCGIITCKYLIVTDLIHKEHFTRQHLSSKGITLPKDYHFVGGTCYSERASLMKALQQLPIELTDFEDTERGYFSFAHALERILTAIPASNGLLKGNDACKLRFAIRQREGADLLALNGARILKDIDVELSDDFILRRLENHKIYEYAMVEKAIGDIYVSRKRIKTRLTDCAPYFFLEGDEKTYDEYCKYLRRTDYMNLSQQQYEKTVKESSISHFRSTIEELEKNGYDPHRPIVINQDDCILDGQHRACWIRHRYGPDHKIHVLRLVMGKPREDVPIADSEEAKALIIAAIDSAVFNVKVKTGQVKE